MNTTSLQSKIREMDSTELENQAAELVNKKNSSVGLTGEEQEALWVIPKYYRQLTGFELVVDTNLQMVS